ncbi:alpha/beta-hydrolase [Polyplosphaeria fusca]|uniref:Alpha/beta-hydrolase n=1 Tax=Polyplosphaeria fusca TaxID=682080 RepID=A0A9P4R5H8_9PLEO|nr:alpha/beta-hydrolase [Polyplosphaeria fusca]
MQINATESLKFHSCENGFECAKLKLPLDHFNGSHPKSFVSVAIAKLPAQVPVDDPRYGGPILINPGGPGGPGVFFNFLVGRQLQTVVDSAEDPKTSNHKNSSARYFDIIGFDPRGIGETEPSATCMPNVPSAWSWMLRELSEGQLGSSDAALGRLWSMSEAFGSSCKKNSEKQEEPDIKRYMSTAAVAHDMLDIVEKHAVWVAEKTVAVSKASRGCKDSAMKIQSAAKKAKLQYWGFSYGTYLGATFASMYPDRIERFILDGVVNSDDYNASLGNGSLHDTEKVMSTFYSYCANVGPAACPLAASSSSPGDIEDRLQRIVKSLYHNPIGIDTPFGPEVLTYSDIRTLLFLSLYSPGLIFPFLGSFLVNVEARHGPVLDQYVAGLRSAHVYSCPLNASAPQKIPTNVPTWAILCGDGKDVTDDDIADFEEYWHELEKISPTSGAIWSSLRMKCNHWNIRPAYRYQGEFSANTSHPILWLSNTADPVTPRKSGRIMAERFPGSVQLVQDSAGHCSLSTPTPCTLHYIRKYFQTGDLPPENTMCVPPSSALSLNSTDSTSRFHDPSLKAVGNGELWGNTMQLEVAMAAAERLQQWASEDNLWIMGSMHQAEDRNLLAISQMIKGRRLALTDLYP